jgi:hypothetical protein
MEPTDYWLRANSEDLTDAKIRDQEVLKILRDMTLTDKDFYFRDLRLPEALYKEPNLPPKFEQFGKYFLNGKNVRQLASLLFEVILEKEKITANENSSNAFISLWRLALEFPI